MINQGFFLRPQSGAAQWSLTSKMHQICGAPNLIQKEIPSKEKSLVDQLPLDQNLLKTVLSWTT